MPPTIPIQTPDPETERPRAWTVAAVGLAALVVGILLVRSTLEPPADAEESLPAEAERAIPRPAPAEAVVGETPPAPADHGAPERAAVAEAETDVATREAEADDAEPSGVAETAEPEPEAPDTAETPPATAPTTPAGAPATDRQVRFGRIAYLRCDGAETNEGPYPCPRDRDLERAALAAIETLPACPNAPPGTGEADVRIHYVRGGPNEILLRDGSGDGRLDGPRVLACLREPLSQLTTTIEADQLVVSFRFELVRED